ncbi:hypothetical protein B23_0491 [Geobacillus thermoleovorans B23]|nr:hypothetical protein B23_0491 [Geobacillus thermoleovorans B23]
MLFDPFFQLVDGSRYVYDDRSALAAVVFDCAE